MYRVCISIPDEIHEKIISEGYRVNPLINMLLDKYFATGDCIKPTEMENINDMSFSEQIKYACDNLSINVDNIIQNGNPTCEEMLNVTVFLKNRGVITTQESVYKRFMHDNGLD